MCRSGAQTGATPDGRYAHTPVADGVSPAAGRDAHGPTAAANSVSKLDHFIAVERDAVQYEVPPVRARRAGGLESFVALVRGYFDQKGSHMQFNVVSRETLLRRAEAPGKVQEPCGARRGIQRAVHDAVKGALQDDIINRTEQMGF